MPKLREEVFTWLSIQEYTNKLNTHRLELSHSRHLNVNIFKWTSVVSQAINRKCSPTNHYASWIMHMLAPLCKFIPFIK